MVDAFAVKLVGVDLLHDRSLDLLRDPHGGAVVHERGQFAASRDYTMLLMADRTGRIGSDDVERHAVQHGAGPGRCRYTLTVQVTESWSEDASAVLVNVFSNSIVGPDDALNMPAFWTVLNAPLAVNVFARV